jgi:hypothetical protein
MRCQQLVRRIDVRRKEPVLLIKQHFFTQNGASLFQFGRGLQAIAQVQALRRCQPSNSQNPTGVLGRFLNARNLIVSGSLHFMSERVIQSNGGRLVVVSISPT